uniref:Nanos n=1 Tax=Amphipholis kochii TaxID=857497 RepID=A0A1B1Q5V7_9ECHI|nr:nanos [Amphipholis kochii]
MASNSNVWLMRTSMQQEEFKPFEDYLGLFNLVKNLNRELVGNVGDHLDTAGTCNSPNYRPCARPRSLSTSSSAQSEEFSWDDFKLNGVDVDPEDGFMPFQPTRFNTRKLTSRLPSAKNRRTPTWCVFCKNNGESEMVYGAHILKDAEGRTSCPILRNYTCPICGVSGDGAHTIKYCPLNKEETFPPSANLLKTARTSAGKKREIPSTSLLDRLN